MGPDRAARELRRIARRIDADGDPSARRIAGALGAVLAAVETDAAEEQVSFSIFVLEQVTDEMRKDMGVAPDAEPFESGANSAVFVNGKGNIVVFSDYPNLFEVVKKAKSLRSDSLPDIYDARQFKLEDDEPGTFSFGENSMYGIEMEHLNVLDSDESRLWEKWQKKIFKPDFKGLPDDVPADEKEFVEAIVSLKERSERDNVVQGDLWSGNIARDDEGKLKFIDLEVVDLDGVDMALQAPAA